MEVVEGQRCAVILQHHGYLAALPKYRICQFRVIVVSAANIVGLKFQKAIKKHFGVLSLAFSLLLFEAFNRCAYKKHVMTGNCT